MMTTQVPQLGTLQVTHAPTVGSTTGTVIGGVLLGIGGLALFYFGAGAVADGGIVGVIFGVILIAAGVYAIYRAYMNAGKNVQVYSDGLVSTTRQGTDIFRWDQIIGAWQSVTRHYRNGIYTGTTHTYTIQGADGRKAVFNDALRNVEKLGDAIQKQTFSYLFPRAVASFMAGQPLNFGKLTISQQGVSNGRETVLWGEIKQFRLHQGVISISKQGRWFNWSNATVAQTPNVFVFLALVDHIKGLNR